jgi:excisionase family DNA binding protein
MPLPMSIKERIDSFGRALEAKELATLFNVTEDLIYKQARTGVMPSFKIGTLVRFDPKALCEWIDKQ